MDVTSRALFLGAYTLSAITNTVLLFLNVFNNKPVITGILLLMLAHEQGNDLLVVALLHALLDRRELANEKLKLLYP